MIVAIFFLRLPDNATPRGTPLAPGSTRIAVPGLPDSGIGSSTSGFSDGVPLADDQERTRPVFQRQLAKRGHPFFSAPSDNDKRPRQE